MSTTPSLKSDLLDVAERAAWTFVQSFLAVLVLTDTSTVRTAVVGALAAAIVPVKELAKRRLTALEGDEDSDQLRLF